MTLRRGAEHSGAIPWLLASDPAIRWQTLRDVMDAPESEWSAERAKVETQGWGARLLALQGADGQWAGGAFIPAGFTRTDWDAEGQPWTATSFVLTQLREFGLDPQCRSARRTVAAVGANSHWDEGGQPFWDGETEECINGRTVADGAYFGVDVSRIVERLLAQRQPDGGWNCARCDGSPKSSFATTINVLEGLIQFERSGARTRAAEEARLSAEEYLLQRKLFRRLTDGRPADDRFLSLLHPHRWRYDVLRALDYFRASSMLTGRPPDGRLAEAIAWLRSRRLDDGTWPLDWKLPGRVWFDMDEGPGHPSKWVTLKALRVLKWWDAAAGSQGSTTPSHG